MLRRRLWRWPSLTRSSRMRRRLYWRVEVSLCPEPPPLNLQTSLKVLHAFEIYKSKFVYKFMCKQSINNLSHSTQYNNINTAFSFIDVKKFLQQIWINKASTANQRKRSAETWQSFHRWTSCLLLNQVCFISPCVSSGPTRPELPVQISRRNRSPRPASSFST